MSKSKRLLSLANLAEHEEHRAARALGECHKLLSEQNTRLEELKAYRHEYLSQIQHLARTGLDIETVHRYQLFVRRLDETIGMQAVLVERIQDECREKRQAWSSARVKHKALDKAVARHRAGEMRRRDRREQQHGDEHASSRYRCLEDDGGG